MTGGREPGERLGFLLDDLAQKVDHLRRSTILYHDLMGFDHHLQLVPGVSGRVGDGASMTGDIPSEIPTPPAKLSAREKVWGHVTTALHEVGLIHRTDALALTVIVRTFVRWLDAENSSIRSSTATPAATSSRRRMATSSRISYSTWPAGCVAICSSGSRGGAYDPELCESGRIAQPAAAGHAV